MREGGTLENVVEERPNAARTTTTYRIFAQTNPITQLGVYEGDFSFNGGLRGIMKCDAPNPRVPLTTHQPMKFLWISGNPIPHYYVPFIRIHIFTKNWAEGVLPNIQPV